MSSVAGLLSASIQEKRHGDGSGNVHVGGEDEVDTRWNSSFAQMVFDAVELRSDRYGEAWRELVWFFAYKYGLLSHHTHLTTEFSQ